MSIDPNVLYSQEFYRVTGPGSLHSAQQVIPALWHLLKPPSTAVDVGCGQGTWLEALKHLLPETVCFGIDGPWVEPKPGFEFISVDMEGPLNLPGLPDYVFDLGICCEVMEHLTPDAASRWLVWLAHHADQIIFSAAPPGQDGAGHINCQPHEFWHECFARKLKFPVVVRSILETLDVLPWYRDNIYIYQDAEPLAHFLPVSRYINLPARIDRKERLQQRFRQHRIYASLALGIVETPTSDWTAAPGAWGCSLSHQKLFQEALQQNYDSLMIFEDDALPVEDFTTRLNTLWADVPSDWQILYLGCNNIEMPIPVTGRVARVRRAFTTHAYALKPAAMKAILEHPEIKTHAIDHVLLDIQQKLPCYCFTPSLVTQEEGYSDIMQRNVDYTGVIR